MGTTETARLRDGRRLTYVQHGAPSGRPVFLFHGMPGSRKGPRPRAQMLYIQGLRLIAYDRPGYGGSDRMVGRTVADAAADVAELADRLGIERFAVVGRSGGSPHALACAALLPERVTRAAALVTLAPRDRMGREAWYRGMSERNTVWYRAAERGLDWYTARVSAPIAAIRADLDRLQPYEEAAMSPSDRAVVADYGVKMMLTENFVEGLRASPGGWIDDSLALTQPWGFDPERILCPVLLWHGTKDSYVPPGHSQWLAERIPDAQMRLVDGVAHFSSVKELPRALEWAAADAQPQPQPHEPRPHTPSPRIRRIDPEAYSSPDVGDESAA